VGKPELNLNSELGFRVPRPYILRPPLLTPAPTSSELSRGAGIVEEVVGTGLVEEVEGTWVISLSMHSAEPLAAAFLNLPATLSTARRLLPCTPSQI